MTASPPQSPSPASDAGGGQVRSAVSARRKQRRWPSAAAGPLLLGISLLHPTLAEGIAAIITAAVTLTIFGTAMY